MSINQDLHEARAAFNRMKNIATTLFVIMVVIYILSKIFEPKFPFLVFFRAFSEAAMVGALADWFAVTALFRHPLGLPIPHTAIIPRSKDRIGEGLGSFISRNFLQPEQVKSRLENIDLSSAVANWINEPNRAQKVAAGISSALPRIMSLVKDGPINDWIQRSITNKIKNLDVATLLADSIAILTNNNRHKPIVDMIIFHTDLAMHKYEPEFRKKVTSKTGWLPKLFSVDSTASDSLLSAIKDTLNEAAQDPNHELRKYIDEALRHFEHNLRFDPNLREQISNWVKEMAEHPTVKNYVASIWIDIKQSFTNPNSDNYSQIALAIENGLKDFSSALLQNDELRTSINHRLKQWALELADTQGQSVGNMVADTIKGWDATTVVTQIETAVGRDLQYIRINGTVIGGLIGLIIYIISSLFAL